MDGSSSSTALILAAISSIATLVLAIFKIVMDYKTKGREHQWLVDQAAEERDDRARMATDIKSHAADSSKVIVDKIDENSAINVAAIEAGERAYTEANNLSIKIHESGLQLREPSRKTDKEGV